MINPFFVGISIFKNWLPIKKHDFDPLGVNFLSKMTSDSDSSSKNTSIKVNLKFEKSSFCSDLFWILEKNQKSKKIDFLGFQENQNKSLQKLLFSYFGLTHSDVFFDEESESDVIFDIKLAPKGWKIDFLLETRFSKIGFLQKNSILTPYGATFFKK